MRNNLFDRKSAEYEFLSVSKDLPFRSNEIQLGLNAGSQKQETVDATTLNNLFNHLVDNDLYNEQLVLILSANRNVPGASITGNPSEIIDFSQEGQKFVLTSNTEPEVQIVKRVVSGADKNIVQVEELKHRRINFIIDDSQQFVVGTDIGLYCSSNKESGWHLVGESDYFREPFLNYDCLTIIKNPYQGSFRNDLDRFQYFLGTNNGLFGLDNSDYFNDYVFWDKIGEHIVPNPLDSGKISSIRLDLEEKCLFVGVVDCEQAGLWKIGGTNSGSLTITKEAYTDFNVNTVEILKSEFEPLRSKDEHILLGTDTGIKQSSTKIFPKQVSEFLSFPGETITAFGTSNSGLVYIGTDQNLYDTNKTVVPFFAGKHIDWITIFEQYNFVVADHKVYVRSRGEDWAEFRHFEGISCAVGLCVINNVLACVLEQESGIQLVAAIYDQETRQFLPETSSIDCPPGSGQKVYGIKTHQDKIYIGTENGVNVFHVLDGGERRSKVVRLPNNLLGSKIDLLDLVGNTVLAISNETHKIFKTPRSNSSLDYSEVIWENWGSTIVSNIKTFDFDVFLFTSSGLFLTNTNLEQPTKLDFSGQEITAFCRLGTEVAFVVGSKIYRCGWENFRSGNFSQVDLLLSDQRKIKEVFSDQNGKILVVFEQEDQNLEIDQFEIQTIESRTPGTYALCSDVPANSNIVQEIYTETSGTTDVSDQLFLSGQNGLDFFVYENQDNTKNFFLSDNWFCFSRNFSDLDGESGTFGTKLEILSNTVYDYVVFDQRYCYGFSYPYVDAEELTPVMYLGTNSGVVKFGVDQNLNFGTNPRFVDQSGAPTPYRREGSGFGHIKDFCRSDTLDPSLLAYTIQANHGNKIVAIKRGFSETPYDVYTANNNAESYHLNSDQPYCISYRSIELEIPGTGIFGAIPTQNGIYSLSSVQGSSDQTLFVGLVKTSEISASSITTDGETQYILNSENFILSSHNTSDWNPITGNIVDVFSGISCSEILELKNEDDDPILVVKTNKKQDQDWEDCYFLTNNFSFAWNLDHEDASVELVGSSSSPRNIRAIAQVGSGKLIVGSVNPENGTSEISSISDFTWNDDETIGFTTTHILALDFMLDDVVVDQSGNLFVTGKSISDTQVSKWYFDDGSGFQEKPLPAVFKKFLITGPYFNGIQPREIYAYCSAPDSMIDLWKLDEQNGFEKILTRWDISIDQIIKINTSDSDIFNGHTILFSEWEVNFLVNGFNCTGSSFDIDQNFKAEKIAGFQFPKTVVIAAFGSEEEKLKIYTTSKYVSDFESIIIAETNIPGSSVVDISIKPIDENQAQLVLLLHNGSEYQLRRIILSYTEETGLVEANLWPDHPYFDNFVSALVFPEQTSDPIIINSFAEIYNSQTWESDRFKIFFSTNHGIGYLEKLQDGSVSIQTTATPTGLNLPNLPSSRIFDLGNEIFLGSGSIKKINKSDLSFQEKHPQDFSGIVGILDQEKVYGVDQNGIALDIEQIDWNTEAEPSVSRITSIEQTPINTMLVGQELSNCIFGANDGLYGSKMVSDPPEFRTENLLSGFSVDCIEFIQEQPVFGLHLLCLDLEFDYLSSTLEDLTMETNSRVLSLKTVSNDEIAIFDQTSIQIYNPTVSSLTNLDLYDFSKILGTKVYKLSSVEISNGNIYVVANDDTILKFRSYEKRRIFGDCIGNYKILNQKIKTGKYQVNNIFLIDDRNLLVATKPLHPDQQYSFHHIKDLRMDLALKDQDGIPISDQSRTINTVITGISDGYQEKTLFSSGKNLYRSFDRITSALEVEIPTENEDHKSITSLFPEKDATYLIGTTQGLYLTIPEFTLDDELKRWDVDSVSKLMEQNLSLELQHHISEKHEGTNLESEFLSALNSKMTIAPSSIPTWPTSKSGPIIYDSLETISSDIVVGFETNDSNKYIRGSVKNWITDLYGGESTYSVDGFVDQMLDPYDKTLIDFSDVPYVCKLWKSGLKEFEIYVPTTMTYYINNPKGFSNSKYSEASFPRLNANNAIVSNTITEKCTHYQLVLDNNHFQLKNISMIQICGNSLPLRIYRDGTYCQDGRENLFDSVIQPSVVNSIPTIVGDGVNNVTDLVDTSRYLRINFSIYGSDAQSIKILAE